MNHMRKVWLFLPLALILGSGCAKNNPNAPASVHGVVTLDGAPVTGGTVTVFVDSAGNKVRYPMQIDKDGNFAGTDLPTGELTVTVETESLNVKLGNKDINEYAKKSGHVDQNANMRKMMQERGNKIPEPGSAEVSQGKYVPVPTRYQKPETSPLRLHLAKGEQKEDLKLTK